MTKDEALKLALEVLEEGVQGTRPLGVATLEAIATIKEALAQPDQEPFGYFQYSIQLDAWVQNRINDKGVAFYITPLQRTWVGLTDEEVNKLVDDEDWYNDPHEFAKAVEAALRSKNT